MATVYLAEDLRHAELDPVGGGDIAAARHTNHLRLAEDWARMQYDRLADQPQLVGAFWQDLLTSLHLLGEHQTELAERASEWCESHGERTVACAQALYRAGQIDGADVSSN